MTHIDKRCGPDANLRRQAEEIAGQKATSSPPSPATMSPEKTQLLLHELRVHQIELEMQNEELRRAQMELDTARARYFDLYDLAPVGYCTVSESGLILEANFTAATLLGVERSVLVKRPISRFIFKADQDIYYLFRKQLFESGAAQSCQLRMLKADSPPFWAHLAATVAPEAEGVPALRLVLSDVSAHQLMESAMQESEERFRTLIDGTSEPIVVHRGEKVIYVNPAAITLFGAGSDQDLLDHPILDLIHPDFHPSVLARVERLTRQGGRTLMVEEKCLRLDGSSIDVEVQNTLIRYDGEAAIQIALRDVTERKRLDQALQKTYADLESATLLAEKASLAKSDFLSSMSHELRSPLNAILGFAQLMESGTPLPTPSQKASIHQILQAGWYLLDLINEILDLALIESGKLLLSMEPMSLPEVLLDCQAMIEPQAQQRNISVSFSEFDSPIFVRADRTRLKQVLINLLSNAIKYNREGGTVAVTCRAITAQRLRISVQDSGEGLSPDKLAQLFQPFNRLGQETGAAEGTGIGLVVSKRLAELMEGEIGVESTVGVGSVFWVELNRVDALQLPAEVEPHASRQAPAEPGAVQRTLLYVEDNQANLKLVEQLIARRPDMRLLSAGDGTLGIVLARTHQPAVILMDINLPGISGIQALKILREDPATRHIPVLALSANAMPRDIQKGLGAGFFRYLTKPIKVNEFMQALDQALEFAATGVDKAIGPPPP